MGAVTVTVLDFVLVTVRAALPGAAVDGARPLVPVARSTTEAARVVVSPSVPARAGDAVESMATAVRPSATCRSCCATPAAVSAKPVGGESLRVDAPKANLAVPLSRGAQQSRMPIGGVQ